MFSNMSTCGSGVAVSNESFSSDCRVPGTQALCDLSLVTPVLDHFAHCNRRTQTVIHKHRNVFGLFWKLGSPVLMGHGSRGPLCRITM